MWPLLFFIYINRVLFIFLQNPRQTPPSWVPDADAQHCMGCHEQFTFVKRRHHCRACGKVFCSKCSSHFMALPQFGLDRPVRVCNRCDLLMNGTYDLSNHATSPTGTGSSSDNGPEMATSPTSGNTSRSPTQWNRYYGMVSWFSFLLFSHRYMFYWYLKAERSLKNLSKKIVGFQELKVDLKIMGTC